MTNLSIDQEITAMEAPLKEAQKLYTLQIKEHISTVGCNVMYITELAHKLSKVETELNCWDMSKNNKLDEVMEFVKDELAETETTNDLNRKIELEAYSEWLREMPFWILNKI